MKERKSRIGAWSSGRVIGVLLLVQLVGMMLAFAPLMPSVGPDFLTKAADMDTTIRMSVILLFVNSALTLAMSLVAFPVLRQYSVRTAIALVAVATVWIALQAVDNAHLMSMLSMSERYAEAGGANAAVYDLVGASLRSTRRFVHYATLLTIDVWFGLFYGALLAFRLVPRWLGAIGVVAVAMHTIGIALSVFIGYALIGPLAFGLPVAYLLFGVWLVWKGFSEEGN